MTAPSGYGIWQLAGQGSRLPTTRKVFEPFVFTLHSKFLITVHIKVMKLQLDESEVHVKFYRIANKNKLHLTS